MRLSWTLCDIEPIFLVPETTTMAAVAPQQNTTEENCNVMKSRKEPVVKSKLV